MDGAVGPIGEDGLPETGLSEGLRRLVRGDRSELAALLHDVEVHASIAGTKVTCHSHSLMLDGMGRPRVADLAAALRDRALDFAIPRSRIVEAEAHRERTRSNARLMKLYHEALALFTDIANSGEGGELLLFALGESVLRLPQVMCKMYLKTNRRMHVHGADGVHVGVDEATGRLAIYWGESKIYSDATQAITRCLQSLAPMLTGTGPDAASTRDLQLLQQWADLADPSLETALKRFLDPDDPAFNSLELRGLCLVGFDCEAYPTEVATMQQHELKGAIEGLLPAWKGHIARRISEEGLTPFAIHMLAVPFPSVDSFRSAMSRALGVSGAAA